MPAEFGSGSESSRRLRTNSASRPTTAPMSSPVLGQHASAPRHVLGKPRIGGELHPVGDLVQAHPQPEIGRLDPQLALDGDDVGVHQQQAAAVGGERVVLAENARGHERQHGTGLRAGDPAGESPAPRCPARRFRPSSPASTRPPPESTRAGRRCGPSGIGPSVCRPVTSRTGGSAARDAAAQLVDRLAAGVVGGRWSGPGQPVADRGRESPVDRAADGQLGRGGHDPHPHDHSVVARASIAVRPVGPASLEMNAKVSTRPLLVGHHTGQRVDGGQRAGLGAQPAGRAAAGGRVEEAVGQRAAAAGDRQQIQQRPQRRLIRAPPPHRRRRQGVGGQAVVDRQPAGIHQRSALSCRCCAVRADWSPRRPRR